MRVAIRFGLQAIGVVCWLAAGVIGFIGCCAVVAQEWGFAGVVVGIMLAPVTFVAAPIYAGVAYHNWSLLILSYGGIGVAYLCGALAGAVTKTG